jgi:tetratricopeptide (TPR) repeat protein
MTDPVEPHRPSLPRRMVRLVDPAQPGCLARLARVLGALALLAACSTCAAGAVFARTELGRYAVLYVLYQNKANDLCATYADGLIRDYPTSNWHYYRIKAACLRRMGRFEESLAVYDEAIRALPDDWWPYSHRCYYRGLLDDPEAVLADCDRAVAMQPDDPSLGDPVIAHDRRAIIRDLVGDRQGAIEDLEAALALTDQGVPGGYADSVRRDREEWLATLEAGGDPITQDVIWSELAVYGTPRQ